MTFKKKLSIGKAILRIFTIVPLVFSLIRNFFILFFLIILIGCLTFTIWLCVLSVLFLYFQSLNLSPIISFLILIGINLVFLIIIAFSIRKTSKRIGFPLLTMQMESLKKLKD